MRLGFIGLGSHGGPMAQRLIDAGHPVTLWARRPETLAAFAGASLEIAPGIAELGAQSDLVGICVVDDAGVRQVCDTLIPAMRSGSLIAIHSTIHPDTCAMIAQQAATRGIALIDAPVSGGAPAAAAGKLTVMVGGAAEAVAIARPIFEAFASVIIHLGDVGAGQKAKLINNTLLAANMALAHSALSSGAELGLDRAALVELINVSSGRSFGFEVCARITDLSLWAHGAKLLIKDVGLLSEILEASPSLPPLRDTAGPFLDLVLQR